MTVPRRSPKSDATGKSAGSAKSDPGPEPRRRRRSRRKATGPAPPGTEGGDPAAELALMAQLASKAAGNLAGLADLAEAEAVPDADADAGAGAGGVRRIAVVVADGREAAITTVLDKLRHKVDELIVVHDGTDEGTRAEVEVWMAGQDHRCRLLTPGETEPGTGETGTEAGTGTEPGLHLALADLRRRLAAGGLDSRDLVLTAGTGGRHDLDVLDDLVRQAVDQDLDALLVRRDRSAQPRHARLGHRLLSAWATLWAGGVRLHDPRSPFRIVRLGPLVHALDRYDPRRPSEAVEAAVVLSRLRYAVRNDVLVDVPPDGRERLRPAELVADLVAIPRAAVRVTTRRERPRPAPSLVPPFAVGLALVAAPALLAGALVRAVARRRRR